MLSVTFTGCEHDRLQTTALNLESAATDDEAEVAYKTEKQMADRKTADMAAGRG